MEGTDEQEDNHEAEGISERVDRREILKGAAIITAVGGIVLSNSQSSDIEQLTRAENRLAELATRINDRDVVDPKESERLRRRVSEGVETANDALAEVSSDNPETEQRLSALRAARDYYTRLADALETANEVGVEVAASEFAVLNHEGSFNFDPAAHFDTTGLDKSITRLSNAMREPQTVTSQGRKLVPDQQRVVDSLEQQLDVLNLHITTQQAYLDTATTIEAGTRALEQSRFDAARSALTEARESLTTGIPETSHRYRLSDAGLSLGQYATLLTRRHLAVEKLLDVSDPSVPKRLKRSVVNEAVDLLFEGRQVVLRRA